MTEENLITLNHINLVESKISKNIRVLLKDSLYLKKKCISMVYISFIH